MAYFGWHRRFDKVLIIPQNFINTSWNIEFNLIEFGTLEHGSWEYLLKVWTVGITHLYVRYTWEIVYRKLWRSFSLIVAHFSPMKSENEIFRTDHESVWKCGIFWLKYWTSTSFFQPKSFFKMMVISIARVRISLVLS